MDLDAFEAHLVKEMVECDMDVERIRPPALSPEKLARYARAADHGLHGVLCDEIGLNQFMIYRGATLTGTPEFEGFRSKYNHDWGAITGVLRELEDFLRAREVKLAIINGPRLYEIASLNLPTVHRDDLISCISNIEEIKSSTTTGNKKVSMEKERGAATSSSTGKSPRAKTPPRPWKEKAKRPVRLDATKHEAKLKEVLGRELLPSERMETKEVFCLSERAGQPVAALSLAYGKALLQRNGRLPTPSRGASKSTKGGGDGGVPP
jgi:hypothetical protein